MMKHMLTVVMDGIKDAEMLVGYAEHAMKHNADHNTIAWFATRAQSRFSMAERDWKDVDEHLKTEKHDEELVEALECHVNRWMENLRERMSKI